jgi:nicotinamidase-related amidase
MRRREFTNLALAGAIGVISPTGVLAQLRPDAEKPLGPNEPGRISADHSFAVIVDLQQSFLTKLDENQSSRLLYATKDFARLASLLQIPIVLTLEKPIEENGSVPQEIAEELTGQARTFQKAYFDLSREAPIKHYLSGLGRKQAIVVGCETDVCVLQSCLGLLGLGYEVYLVEDLLFTSSRDSNAALARMKAAGAVFLTYKTLYYELTQTVEFQSALETGGPLTKGFSH